MIAARVAEELRKEDDTDVRLVKGNFLELSVSVDDHKVIETNPLWYPLPSTLVRTIRDFRIVKNKS